MKRLSTTMIMLMLFFTLGVFAEESGEVARIYLDWDSAMESGKPIVAMIHNSKVCACTLKKCVQALDLTRKLAQENSGNYSYLEIDLGENPELNNRYRTTIVPTVIFFDKDGKEMNRLQSMQIREEAVRDEITSLLGNTQEEKKSE